MEASIPCGAGGRDAPEHRRRGAAGPGQRRGVGCLSSEVEIYGLRSSSIKKFRSGTTAPCLPPPSPTLVGKGSGARHTMMGFEEPGRGVQTAALPWPGPPHRWGPWGRRTGCRRASRRPPAASGRTGGRGGDRRSFDDPPGIWSWLPSLVSHRLKPVVVKTVDCGLWWGFGNNFVIN